MPPATGLRDPSDFCNFAIETAVLRILPAACKRTYNNKTNLNKVVLKFELDFDFILIAIACPLKDYRLCHFINKHTGLELRKVKDHQLPAPRAGEWWMFSMYLYLPESVETEYYLISNKGEENGYLIPEMKNTDYFLMIKNFIDEEDLDALVNAINAIPDVVVASEITPDKLKSKENLIF